MIEVVSFQTYNPKSHSNFAVTSGLFDLNFSTARYSNLLNNALKVNGELEALQ